MGIHNMRVAIMGIHNRRMKREEVASELERVR